MDANDGIGTYDLCVIHQTINSSQSWLWLIYIYYIIIYIHILRYYVMILKSLRCINHHVTWSRAIPRLENGFFGSASCRATPRSGSSAWCWGEKLSSHRDHCIGWRENSQESARFPMGKSVEPRGKIDGTSYFSWLREEQVMQLMLKREIS